MKETVTGYLFTINTSTIQKTLPSTKTPPYYHNSFLLL